MIKSNDKRNSNFGIQLIVNKKKAFKPWHIQYCSYQLLLQMNGKKSAKLAKLQFKSLKKIEESNETPQFLQYLTK
jgi:hypothetical protein